MSKTKYKKQNKKINNNDKAKAVVGVYLSTRNTYHELLFEKWIVKRSRFHAS